MQIEIDPTILALVTRIRDSHPEYITLSDSEIIESLIAAKFSEQFDASKS